MHAKWGDRSVLSEFSRSQVGRSRNHELRPHLLRGSLGFASGSPSIFSSNLLFPSYLTWVMTPPVMVRLMFKRDETSSVFDSNSASPNVLGATFVKIAPLRAYEAMLPPSASRCFLSVDCPIALRISVMCSGFPAARSASRALPTLLPCRRELSCTPNSSSLGMSFKVSCKPCKYAFASRIKSWYSRISACFFSIRFSSSLLRLMYGTPFSRAFSEYHRPFRPVNGKTWQTKRFVSAISNPFRANIKRNSMAVRKWCFCAGLILFVQRGFSVQSPV